ncbi:hypothetical protein [Falsibacillus albus]|nr:hypothetical protein [Falsibacillus albus]
MMTFFGVNDGVVADPEEVNSILPQKSTHLNSETSFFHFMTHGFTEFTVK